LAQRHSCLAEWAGRVDEVGLDPFSEALLVEPVVALEELPGILELFNIIETDAAGEVFSLLRLVPHRVVSQDRHDYGVFKLRGFLHVEVGRDS